MRVLLTTDTVGGLWTHTLELTKGLLERGHVVILVSFGGTATAEHLGWCRSITEQFAESFSYIFSSLPLEWMQENHSFYEDAVVFLQTIVERFDPDLFHSNQFCFGFTEWGIPILVAAHSDVLSWARACTPNALEPSRWLLDYIHLVQRGLDGAGAVVAPTNCMLKSLMDGFSVAVPTMVIANGRNLIPPARKKIRVLQAVVAGRLWDIGKNISILKDVRSPIPILLAGDVGLGIKDGSLSENVSVIGYLDGHELLNLFRRSSIYIVTSLYEPFGQAGLEAALCGCALLCNDITSQREVWGEAAIYFRNSADLEYKLDRLSKNSARLRSAQRSAYQRATCFSADRMTESYLHCYQSLIERDVINTQGTDVHAY